MKEIIELIDSTCSQRWPTSAQERCAGSRLKTELALPDGRIAVAIRRYCPSCPRLPLTNAFVPCKYTPARSDSRATTEINSSGGEVQSSVLVRQLIMHMLIQSRRSSCGAPMINAKRLAVFFFRIFWKAPCVDSPNRRMCLAIFVGILMKRHDAHRSSSQVQSS